MITKQYEQMLLAQLSYGTYTGTTFTGSTFTVTANGATFPKMVIPTISKTYSEETSNTASNSGVIFGDGTEAPTADDTGLSGDVVTGLTVTINQTFTREAGKTVITNVYTVLNNNDAAVTISEIALKGVWNYSSTSALNYLFMVDRTLLQTPVTIAPNGVGQVTYTITMDYSE